MDSNAKKSDPSHRRHDAGCPAAVGYDEWAETICESMDDTYEEYLAEARCTCRLTGD